ncbi:MAG: UDP-N-acetylmuramoyl-tripeptide--D-alanyl-D-alanine ligase [Candidatus Saccharimonadales bacterium]
MFKNYVQKKLEKYVRKYFSKHDTKLIVITGSVGKTGTKMAIAQVLSGKYRIRLHDGNHNTSMSVPLAILGVDYPQNIHSIMAWLAVFKAARKRIKMPTDADVIVQELGTDRPGDIPHFASYLKPDIAVITAVTEEHMVNFQTLEAVAKEELAIAKVARVTIVNSDDIPQQFAQYADTSSIMSYGLRPPAEFRIDLAGTAPLEGKTGRLFGPDMEAVPVSINVVGKHNIAPAAAAAAVGFKLGLNTEEVAVGISKISPLPGRMQVLRGLEDAVILDDTYNSSPAATIAALETLYDIDAPQHIAILGSMNEMGEFSKEAHERVGDTCDGTRLDWVITIGKEAAEYLAPRAAANRCQVKSFMSPYEAGGFAHTVLQPKAAILVKGSQNDVFSEEAVKVLLHDQADVDKLVRQSPDWLAKKDSFLDKELDDRKDD